MNKGNYVAIPIAIGILLSSSLAFDSSSGRIAPIIVLFFAQQFYFTQSSKGFAKPQRNYGDFCIFSL